MVYIIFVIFSTIFCTSAGKKELPDISNLKTVQIKPSDLLNLTQIFANQIIKRSYQELEGEDFKGEYHQIPYYINNKAKTKKDKPIHEANKSRIRKKDLANPLYANIDVFGNTKVIKEKREDIKEKAADIKETYGRIKEESESAEESDDSDENDTPILRNAEFDLNYDIDDTELRIKWK